MKQYLSFSKKFETLVNYGKSSSSITCQFDYLAGYPTDLKDNIQKFKFPPGEIIQRSHSIISAYLVNIDSKSSIFQFEEYVNEIGFRFGTSHEFISLLFSEISFLDYVKSKRYSETAALTILGDYKNTNRVIELSLSCMQFKDRANKDSFIDNMQPINNHQFFIIKEKDIEYRYHPNNDGIH